MALVRRTNKYGVDRPIDVFQSMLWDNLSMQFGDWDSYPRVYKNKRRKPDNREYFIAEHSHTLKEYLEILFNDKKTMVSFFIKDDQINVDELAATASVSFIVQCDLNKVYPDETERADERLKEDILFFIMRQPNFKIQQTIAGIVTGKHTEQ